MCGGVGVCVCVVCMGVKQRRKVDLCICAEFPQLFVHVCTSVISRLCVIHSQVVKYLEDMETIEAKQAA